MIKILHIIPNLKKGGAERLTIDIVRELSNTNGIEVRLVLLENKIAYNIDDIISFTKIIPSSVKLSFLGRNSSNIHSLQDFINKFQPNIIHTHLFQAELISRFCIYPQAKWFSHCHDNMAQFLNFDIRTLFNKKLMANYYEKKVLFERYKTNNKTHFIAISTHTEEYFKTNAKPYKVTLLHNAINTEKFRFPAPQKKNSKLMLINIGSFEDKKNQSFLIDVATLLKNKEVDFELHLLGDGKNRTSIKQKIKNSDLESLVFLHGHVENVQEFLWRSDIYVHSATYEPFGLVLLEAMASGLPVVSLDGKGNRDILMDGKNSYLIKEVDEIKFADKLIQLWSDKSLYSKMALYSQEFSKQFDSEKYCQNLLDIYNTK